MKQKSTFEESFTRLFFGCEMNQNPIDFIKNTDLIFAHANSYLGNFKVETYSHLFHSHAHINDIEEGEFRIEYSYIDSIELYEMTLSINFTNDLELVEKYDQLVRDFEGFGGKSIIESTQEEDYAILDRTVVYQKFFETPDPHISFSYFITDKSKFSMVITYKNCEPYDLCKEKYILHRRN